MTGILPIRQCTDAGLVHFTAGLNADFQGFMLREGFTTLDITADHAIRAGLLPGAHKDPFDRVLISQAQAEHVPIVSNERSFEASGVRRVW